MSNYYFEAEELTLNGYRARGTCVASDGALIQTWGTGTASTVFGGVSGVYMLDLGVFDENDGQSTIEVLVNGEVVQTITLDQDLNGNFIYGTRTVVSLGEIDLQTGDTLTLRGTADGGEPARIDNVSLLRTGDLAFDAGSRITLLHESFGKIDWSNVVASDYEMVHGVALTDGNDDGQLLLRAVDTSQITDGEISFDLKVASLQKLEETGIFADFLRVELIVDGSTTVLDTFRPDGWSKTLIGDTSGQIFDPSGSSIDYDIPAGADNVQLRFVSSISSKYENILIDNVKITGVFAPLDAVDDAVVVNESESFGDVDGTVRDNDLDVGGTAFTGDVLAVNGSAGNVGQFIDLIGGGRLRLNADGTFDFDAADDFDDLNEGETRDVTATYTIGNSGGSDTATLIVTVEGEANGGPDAVDDTFTTTESAAFTGTLLRNDIDTDASGSLEITAVNGVGFLPNQTQQFVALTSVGGRDALAVINTASEIELIFNPLDSFQPLGAGEVDTVSFEYTITDGYGETDTATVEITVEGEAGPIAVNDTFTVTEGNALTGTLLSNDIDADASGSLEITAVDGIEFLPNQTQQFVAVTSEDGRDALVVVQTDSAIELIFNQLGNFEPLESGETDEVIFNYTIMDANGVSDTAQVSIMIEGLS